jgi:hypothetical protein
MTALRSTNMHDQPLILLDPSPRRTSLLFSLDDRSTLQGKLFKLQQDGASTPA